MRFVTKLSFNLVVTCRFLCCAANAFASTAVTISSSGNGIFILQGTGIDSVAGAQITVVYDTTTLVTPRVTQGGLTSGALMVATTTPPGSIIMAFLKGETPG